LDNHIEANEELQKIEAKLRAHPDVLELRWQIYAKAGNWEGCLDIAAAITECAPDRLFGWLQLSYALHELNRTREAWENLLPVSLRFPTEPMVFYNLACYACQLGKMADSTTLLKKACELDDADRVRIMALDDPDLEALWRRIGEL